MMFDRTPASSSRDECGFTLVELLVALILFGMIAAAGVGLLSFGVRAQAAATERLDEVAGVRRLSMLLTNDLAQTLPRIARDTGGATIRAFTGNDGSSDPLVMGYVRSGWSNPDGLARAEIQRVDIVLNNGQLVRQGYAMVDGTETTASLLLADKVRSVAMRYRDKGGDWRARWDNAALDSAPVAVEMTVTRTNSPPLTLAFLTGPAS